MKFEFVDRFNILWQNDNYRTIIFLVAIILLGILLSLLIIAVSGKKTQAQVAEQERVRLEKKQQKLDKMRKQLEAEQKKLDKEKSNRGQR